MPTSIITLTTDFGVGGWFAGTMKGVVLSVCPEATLVDLSHDIPPHDRQFAALELAAASRYFPIGCVFLVVVDPGVGSGRRGLAADTGDYRFVAPDNGVLTAVFQDTPPKQVVELTERRYARPTLSRTFEGRDRFAPAAGWLAKGIRLAALGRPVKDYQTLDIPVVQIEDDRITGAVLRIDRFGNLVTNIDRKQFERFTANGSIDITVAGRSTFLVRLFVLPRPAATSGFSTISMTLPPPAPFVACISSAPPVLLL